METNINTYKKIPVITLRGVVIYPDSKMHFDIIRKQSIAALRAAMSKDQQVFFVAQKDFSEENPDTKNIYDVGVIANINQLIKNNDGSIKVLIETTDKAKILNIYTNKKFFEADVEIVKNLESIDDIETQARVEIANNLFGEYCSIISKKSDEMLLTSLSSKSDPIFTAEYIAANTNISIEIKQQILTLNNADEKLDVLIEALYAQIDILIVEEEILKKLQYRIDKNQKEYFLREQLKVITEELGEKSPIDEKIKYKERIKKLHLSDKTSEEKLLSEADKLSKISSSSPDSSVIRTYLDTCLGLPWNKSSKDKINIETAQKTLDKEHYGLSDVKERIIEFLAVKKLNPELTGQVLCLCGPPGVGKTSIVKSIAKTMGRVYSKISLGGVKDESEIRGHRKTYIGSMPGRIISAINSSGVNNPLVLLDEIDKMSNDFRGDPSSAMLEVLDTEQNSHFVDHYLEIPFDLSGIIFIATANDKYNIPRPLLDRMEIIEITSYTENEKFSIAKKHLVSKQIKLNGLSNKDVKFSDDALFEIINYYTSESGVRNLERKIAKILRKVAQKKATDENNFTKVTVSKNTVSEYLGPPKFKPDKLLEKDEIGIATGLAWTSVGGEIMNIEVCVLEGNGKIELTGNLGDVMKESARAAISYIRSKAQELGIDKDFYKNKDIHIHVPEGAIPKDGPSAGITICTALISELTKTPVRRDIAMTGEITLRGRVLPIGGLKEKTMAAYRIGIKTVLVPEDNINDLHDIDPEVKKSINFISVSNIESVLKEALVGNKDNAQL